LKKNKKRDGDQTENLKNKMLITFLKINEPGFF